MLSTVSRYLCIGEAEGALSALDAAGIDAVLADDQIVAIDWLYSTAVGYVKVQVRDEDAEEAVTILTDSADVVDEPAAEAVELTEEPIRCPSCGKAETVARIPRLRIFLLLAVVLIGVGSAVHQEDLALAGVVAAAITTALAPSHRCTACGEKWSEASRERALFAPPPDPSDTIENRCPRCGSAEFNQISHRRLIAFSMIFQPMPVLVAAIWLLLPKRRCDDCGFWR